MQIIPEVHTLGSFDPFHFTIELPNHSNAALTESLQFKEYEPASVLSHELCHWNDVIATVWGQEYLDLLFSAYDACIGPDVEEKRFSTIVQLSDAQRKILFPSYYKLILPRARNASISEPWRLRVTCGVFFDTMGVPNESAPIYFLEFQNHHTGEREIRQPLTVGSLLELRAIAAENEAFALYLAMQKDPDRAMVDRAIYERRANEMLYDAHLTTYTVGVHKLANAMGVQNPAEAYRIGSTVSDIALNIETSDSQRLVHPRGNAFLSEQRLNGFRSDRGYVFAALCDHIGESSEWRTRRGLDEGIAAAGMGSYSSIVDSARRSFEKRCSSASYPSLHPQLVDLRTRLARWGLEVFEARLRIGSQLPSQVILLENLPTPMIMTEDLIVQSLTSSGMHAADFGMLDALKDRLNTFTRNVLRACRGLEFDSSDYTY